MHNNGVENSARGHHRSMDNVKDCHSEHKNFRRRSNEEATSKDPNSCRSSMKIATIGSTTNKSEMLRLVVLKAMLVPLSLLCIVLILSIITLPDMRRLLLLLLLLFCLLSLLFCCVFSLLLLL